MKLELSPSFAAGTTSYTVRTEAGEVEIASKPAYFAGSKKESPAPSLRLYWQVL